MSTSGASPVLVTGAGGQLGRALLAAGWPDGVRPVGLRRHELDIASMAQVDRAIAGRGFRAVVNAAAHTAVDDAETDVRGAYATNAIGASNLARACQRHGAVLIHISTDYVFDGTKPSPYVEDDRVNPISVYGRSKAEGEGAIRAQVERHVILRTAWLFSAGRNNFVRKILRLAEEREELAIVADQTGNPTSADDLATAIVSLLGCLLSGARSEGDVPWGTYHCVNAETATWHALAEEVIARADGFLSRRPAVRPIATAQYPRPAPRPANSRLSCDGLESAFGIRLRPWRAALAPIVNEIVAERRS